MEKKNKKKLFAIIGGSVLAFVLTIALSVSITLAYFGGTGTETQSIKLGANVSVANLDDEADLVTVGDDIDNALPGQAVDVTVEAKIVSSGTQKAAVMLLIEGDTTTSLTNVATGWTLYGTASGNSKTYTVYILGTATNMTTVNATTAGTEMTKFSGKYTVATTYVNGDAGEDVASFTATVVAVQYGVDPDAAADSLPFTTAETGDYDLQTIFEDIADVTITAA